jgi:6-phosphogluconolactonase
MQKMVAHRAHVKVCETAHEMGVECAKEFERIINDAIAARGRCSVALSGGTTPSLLYKQLVSNEFIGKVDWTKVHFWVSDERCVALSDKESNFGNAQRQLLDLLDVPAENLHPPVDPENAPAEVAQAYEDAIKQFFELKEGEFPRFDLLLLGMGPDGHCASLFPNTPALKENKRIVVSNSVPGANITHRLTFTFPAINHARNIVFMVQGAEKSHVLGEVLGDSDTVSYPVQQILPDDGHLEWILDQSAAHDFVANRK